MSDTEEATAILDLLRAALPNGLTLRAGDDDE